MRRSESTEGLSQLRFQAQLKDDTSTISKHWQTPAKCSRVPDFGLHATYEGAQTVYGVGAESGTTTTKCKISTGAGASRALGDNVTWLPSKWSCAGAPSPFHKYFGLRKWDARVLPSASNTFRIHVGKSATPFRPLTVTMFFS
eukprot:3941946-Rhodomonas_salina.3